MASYPIIHPHRILTYLFDHVGLQISSSDVRAFWEHSRSVGEPWSLQSPCTSSHIPLGIHGDAARLWTQYKHEKVVAVWMNIVHFRPLSSRHSRFLLFSVPNAVMVKNRTLNRVWRRLVWSFEAAFSGINPTLGEGGRPLHGADAARAGTPITSSNHRFALCEFRGDWEWFRDIWRFTASWKSVNTCFKCPAQIKGDPSLLYHTIGPDCGWIHQEFSLEEFISQRLKDRQLCSLTLSSCFVFPSFECFYLSMPLFFYYDNGARVKKYPLTSLRIALGSQPHWSHCWLWGPLLTITGFHVGCLKWCIMHVVNLGILFSVNAGALSLAASTTLLPQAKQLEI